MYRLKEWKGKENNWRQQPLSRARFAPRVCSMMDVKRVEDDGREVTAMRSAMNYAGT